VLRPGRGAQVASPSAAEARAVFAARRLIEVRLLESPEQPPRREALRGLRRLVANENEASRQGDRSGMIQLSGAFHVELAQACGNAVLAEIIAGLVRRSSLIIALYQTGHVACCRATEHAALLRLLGAGRYREAAAAMEAHLAHIEAGLDPAMQPAPRADLGRALGSRAA
jgi:DNA-binding GntR family transcriptional regulator